MKPGEFLSEEKKTELKDKYKDIYASTLTFKDEENVEHIIEVVHRKPTADDFETFETQSRQSIETARKNMFHDVVIWPEDKKAIHDKIAGRSGIYFQFVESLSPFLALATRVERKKL